MPYSKTVPCEWQEWSGLSHAIPHLSHKRRFWVTTLSRAIATIAVETCVFSAVILAKQETPTWKWPNQDEDHNKKMKQGFR
jgi:hypothetical protein